ncbi:MAG TPA: glucose 1-dehydrogenase [Chloroflexota bacterium]|jgi:3-oxoacyl-[acyl-carrier protein] reductase|nr:glucose 1-dehydrogenase [Chloroflexota bacterium]
MGGLSGKVAVVTGGGTGIGRASALLLAQEGANVVVNYSRSEKEAYETVAELGKLGVKGKAVRADVSNREQAEQLIAEAHKAFGRIDVLVNSAGRTRFIPYPQLDDLTDEVWGEIMQLNLMGAFYTSRAAARHMLDQGDGAIVNIASIAGLGTNASSIPYAVSKGAMITLTKTMARALAPKVRVNAISPGVVETRWVGDNEEFKAQGRAATPLGRNAQAEDVARAVRYFAVEATFVTGQIHIVDGGRVI